MFENTRTSNIKPITIASERPAHFYSLRAYSYSYSVYVYPIHSGLKPPRADKKPSFNPTYHTHMDNYDVATRLTDPGGLPYHAALGRVHVDLLLRLADSARIPFSEVHYRVLAFSTLHVAKATQCDAQ